MCRNKQALQESFDLIATIRLIVLGETGTRNCILPTFLKRNV